MFARILGFRRTVTSLIATIGLLLLAACGGNSSSMSSSGIPSSTGSDSGTVLATMTDAPGDFVSYVVAVNSLQLQKADGATVETVPVATTVDFAQLVNLTELINAGQIPAGNYTGAVMTLDYSSAQITAQDASGNPVQLTPVDGSGNTITGTVQVSVTLDSKHPLIITAGDTARIGFDFNIAASDLVDLTAATVTVSPTLTATIAPSTTSRCGCAARLPAPDPVTSSSTWSLSGRRCRPASSLST